MRDLVDASQSSAIAKAGLADPTPPDWRFLLPVDERSRVLELSGRDDVAIAFAFEADRVVALRASAAHAGILGGRATDAGLRNVDVIAGELSDALPRLVGPFDVVTVHDALDRGARRAAAADERLLVALRRTLTPFGALWIAARNRFSWGAPTHAPTGTRGLDELKRLLHRAGFASVDAWALLPDADRPQEIVPLDSKAAFDYVAERDRSEGKSAVSVALAKSAFRMGLAPRVVPAFGMVARSGERPK